VRLGTGRTAGRCRVPHGRAGLRRRTILFVAGPVPDATGVATCVWQSTVVRTFLANRVATDPGTPSGSPIRPAGERAMLVWRGLVRRRCCCGASPSPGVGRRTTALATIGRWGPPPVRWRLCPRVLVVPAVRLSGRIPRPDAALGMLCVMRSKPGCGCRVVVGLESPTLRLVPRMRRGLDL